MHYEFVHQSQPSLVPMTYESSFERPANATLNNLCMELNIHSYFRECDCTVQNVSYAPSLTTEAVSLLVRWRSAGLRVIINKFKPIPIATDISCSFSDKIRGIDRCGECQVLLTIMTNESSVVSDDCRSPDGGRRSRSMTQALSDQASVSAEGVIRT